MTDSRERLLQVCGATPEVVVRAAEAALLSAQPQPQQVGRYRFAALGENEDALRASLAAWWEKAVPVDDRPRPVVFVYSGQGSQYPQMGKALFEKSRQFRDDVLEVLSLSPRGGVETARRLFDILQSDGQAINEINHTSPILFAFQVALTRLWQRWGVSPDAVVGHSFGEFPAAWCAGVFSLHDGMYLVSERGRLMNEYRLQSTTESRYCVLRADIGDIVELLADYDGRIAVAGVNAPQISTISGSREDIESMVGKLSAQGIKSRVLPVLVPAHSMLLEGPARNFAALCPKVDFRVPTLNWYSTLNGANLRHEGHVDGEYWRRHMVEPVRFWASMVQATANGPSLFLEIGPGETLTSMAAEAVEREEHHWVTSLSAKEVGTRHLMNAALTLWQLGLAVDLDQARTELSGG